ncbi:DMT family transporter [Pseudochryseolinea flava]|uniref:EamA family transporter n=1 Tax=Pseudochryseolinea flava TaxID=2059302 RepID=A0A364Y1J7_9BACT|nr:DMT family transporter [Pseudochryseolinea flava]RAV99819.1 EamA family transporter [Pseudochryseolinea flava]
MASTNDYIKLHFIVFLWGFSAILGMLITIPAVEMVFYRSILAAIGMAILIAATKGSFQITTTDLIKLLFIGFIVGGHWIAFFGSGRISNVSVSLVGFATNSLWAALLEPVFNKVRIKKTEVFLGLLVIAGLYIIFSFKFQYKLGLLLGILAGFSSALFSVFNSKMVRRVPAYTITFYEMIGAALFIALFLPIYKMTWASNHELQLIPTTMDWIYIALLAGVCSVYAYSVAVELMKKISVFMLQLALNLEPLYGIIMALIIFKDKEKMGVNFYLGAALIVSAVLLYPVLKKAKSGKQKS